MNQAYKRTRNLFDPKGKSPFRLSRSRLEGFVQCPRCFYLDRRLGVERPSMPAFTLNSAVDFLLKKEFDQYRLRQQPHPLMIKYGVDAIPLAHSQIDEWREVFKGVQFYDEQRNLILFGAVDDLWVSRQGKIFVVDYKSTSTKAPVTLEGPWKDAYKRQMEIYQWLLRKNSLDISDTGYFLYCNADKERMDFQGQLHFDVEIIAYEGDDSWVGDIIAQAHECLLAQQIPQAAVDCEHCSYVSAVQETSENLFIKSKNQQEEFLF